MKSTIKKRTYQAIYRLLDRVSPIDGDCGTLCNSACCTCQYEPDELEFNAANDVNADNYLGLYLLPGEQKFYEQADDEWIEWGHLMAEDYDFPESWHGKVYFIQCRTAPNCPRNRRPIQCRTFPLAPHIDEDGFFHIILHCDELPYTCPLLEVNKVNNADGVSETHEELSLNEDFIQATYTVWKHLIRDPYIYDLVEMDSEIRIEEKKEIKVLL